MDELKQLKDELNALKKAFAQYEKSGFWTRRDVLKSLGAGGLSLFALSQLVKGDTTISDTEIYIGSSAVSAHIAALSAHGANGNIIGLTDGDGRYAPIAKGVTNGDSHDHNGGDGAQINHTTLSSIGTNTHAQVDTHLAAAAPHSGHVIVVSGSYTGNSTVNRAIAHGLGRTPKFIFITRTQDGYGFIQMAGFANINAQYSNVNSSLAVTAADATNFYVGNATDYNFSANNGSIGYWWVAFG